ncbi:MAG: hypothetical protein AAF430_21305 [Myxococcota bacterium]
MLPLRFVWMVFVVSVASGPALAQLQVVGSVTAIPTGLVDVDPDSGAGTLVSELQVFSGILDADDSGDGDLLVLYAGSPGFFEPAVVRVDPVTGSQTLVARGTGTSVPPGLLDQASAIARGDGGQIVVLGESTAPTLTEIGLAGTQTARPISPSIGDPVDLVVEPSGDVLLYDVAPAFGGGPGVFRVDQTTGVATSIASGGFLSLAGPPPQQARLALLGTRLFVLANGVLVEVDITTGAQTLVSIFVSGTEIDVDALGNPIVFEGTDPTAGTTTTGVYRIDPATATQTPLASGGLLDSEAVAVVVLGSSIYTASTAPNPPFTFSAALVEIFPSTGAQRPVDEVPGVGFFRITVGALGEVFGANAFGGFGSIDPATGAIRAVSPSGFLFSKSDIAIDPTTDDLLALGAFNGAGDGIVRIDTVTGSQLPVAVGGLIQLPVVGGGMAVDDAGGVYLLSVVGAGPASVIRVDLDTGAQTLLPSGPLLSNPVDLAIGPDGDLFIYDTQANLSFAGIVRKDPITGAESLVPTTSGSLPGFGRITAASEDVFVGISGPGGGMDLVYAVDVMTGALTPLSGSGLLGDGIIDLEAPMSLPEPGALVLQATGVVLVLWLARTRRGRQLR